MTRGNKLQRITGCLGLGMDGGKDKRDLKHSNQFGGMAEDSQVKGNVYCCVLNCVIKFYLLIK